jgi:hypothetical protein
MRTFYLLLHTVHAHPAELHLRAADWLSFPPTLTSLTLRASNTLTAENVKLIPRTLTKLVLDNEDKLPTQAFRDLPPNLTEFAVWAPSIPDEDVQLFPRSITRLCLWSSSRFQSNVVCRYLPPRLVKLRVGVMTTSIWTAYYKLREADGTLLEAQIEANEELAYSKFEV